MMLRTSGDITVICTTTNCTTTARLSATEFGEAAYEARQGGWMLRRNPRDGWFCPACAAVERARFGDRGRPQAGKPAAPPAERDGQWVELDDEPPASE